MGSIGGMSPGGSIAVRKFLRTRHHFISGTANLCFELKLGIVVGLLSTSVQSLGLTLQRKSHILEDEKGPYDVRRPPYRRRRWQIGMGMFIVSNVLGSSVQISILPLPVLSTLQASGLVFNSICASLILGEPFTRWSLWGTLLVCVGAVFIAVFGAIPSPAHTLSELLELLVQRPFVIWMSLQAVLVVSMAVAIETVSHVTPLMQHARFRLARGFAYGCISGILSAHSLLVAKSAVELIVRTITDGDNQFVHWQSWVLVLGLVTLALSQLYYLHRGLKLVSTSVLYPLIFCIYNIIAILDGLIYFRQTDLISPLRGCLIALGTVVLLSGVLALSWRLSDEQHTPGVGQSSLAPGLGLIEDTDGEEEEEDLLLASDIESNVAPAHYAYQTFGPDSRIANATEGSAASLPPRKKLSRASASRWTERREIWGELEDGDTAGTPLLSLDPRRSNPRADEASSWMHGRRGASAPMAMPGSAGADQLSRSVIRGRRRRKSTGFPGFTARKASRTSVEPLQDTRPAPAPWRLWWWGRKSKDAPQRSASWAHADDPGETSRDGAGAAAAARRTFSPSDS